MLAKKLTTVIIFSISLIFTGILFVSCQKELDGLTSGGGGTVIPPTNRKPGLGTTWTYRFYTFYSNGQIASNNILVYKAVSEELHGGETWLNIIDTATQATVYLLKIKPDGLYQYTNNNAYLFLKDPALLNDTYSTYHDGATTVFTVKKIMDTLVTTVGNIPLNYYEGKRGNYIFHDIWYSQNYWIAQHFTYFLTTFNIYYRKYALYLLQIKY